MADDQVEQTNAYHEYFEAIKNFNASNAEYAQSANEITNMRKIAIQKAAEVHINPVISRVRAFQMGSVVVGILAFIFFCVGVNLANSPASNSQTGNTIIQAGFSTLLILGSIGAGILAVIVFAWTSSKISSLYSNVREAQDKIINPFAD